MIGLRTISGILLFSCAHACGGGGDGSLMSGIEKAPASTSSQPAPPCGSADLVAVSGECVPARPDAIQSAQLVVDALCLGTDLSSKCEPAAFKYSYKGAVPRAAIARGILGHVQTSGSADGTVEANLAALDALAGKVDAAVTRLERSIPPIERAIQVHQDVVVCQLRPTPEANYPVYLVQPAVAGVKPLPRMVPEGQSVLFRDGSLCHLLGPVETTFAVASDPPAAGGRFSAAWKAGFKFLKGQGSSMFVVEQEGRSPARTGKLRWYMEANLSILLLVRSAGGD